MRDMGIDDRLKDAECLNTEASNTETNASLYLYSDEIDIQSVSELIGCEPTEAHRKGAIIVGRRTPASVGLWHLDAPEHLKFPEKLQYLIDNTTHDIRIWDKLNSGYNIQLRCSIFLHSWTDGFDFPAELFEEIGKRHWKFGFSVYSAEGDEIVDAFLRGNKPSDK